MYNFFSYTVGEDMLLCDGLGMEQCMAILQGRKVRNGKKQTTLGIQPINKEQCEYQFFLNGISAGV